MVDDGPTTRVADAEADGADGPAFPPDGEDTATRPARWWIVPWLIAAVAVLVAMATTSQWLTLRAEEQTRQEVQRAAEEFAVALTTWDASDGLEDTREELRERGTGAFLDEIDELFGGSIGAEAEEFEAVSTGDVQDVFIQRIQDDEAVAFAVIVQELRTNLSDTPERTARSARMTLVREGDRWLVSAVDVLDADFGDDPRGVTGTGDEEETP